MVPEKNGPEQTSYLLAGVDIGNSTTEVSIARWNGSVQFLGSGLSQTTGIKGTSENLAGIQNALSIAAKNSNCELQDLRVICMNAATPVLGDLSMSTITETIITESTMIGHNPDTPGGSGLGFGKTVLPEDLLHCSKDEKVIPVFSHTTSFRSAANLINKASNLNIDVQAAIIQENEGVLISNRIHKKIPIVDEVSQIDAVPIQMPALVEVAEPGWTIKSLSNPYQVATLFGLSPTETQKIAPVSISLTGNRSAVVIKTPKGNVQEKVIRVGRLQLIGAQLSKEVDLALGAEQLLSSVEKIGALEDVIGEPGTASGGMLQHIKNTLSLTSRQPVSQIKIQDIFATDTVVPQKITGGMAGEKTLNKAIGLAAMVWSDKALIQDLITEIETLFGIPVKLGGSEIEMGITGALTTPGTTSPLIAVDMGGGSIDAARFDGQGNLKTVHLAGAGDMVTLLIDNELGLQDRLLAEEIKIYPAAKVESLFHIQMEDGQCQFFDHALDRSLFGKVILLKPNAEMIPVNKDIKLDNLISIRRKAKKNVFIPNILRALRHILPGGNIRAADEMILLGGSALDFELSGMISQFMLEEYGIITGCGNVRGLLGPRNAVATGLILSYCDKINSNRYELSQ